MFVGAAFGGPVSVHVADPATSTAVPHIANLRGDFIASGESACRHAYVYSVPESLTSEEQLRREDPDRRARIDAIKAGLRVEDL
ncbi:hypothetical protein A5719_01845 [Mycolicibacterium peregrinum]|nr:hypothetical protein A5719_01845 [Mycolicibacterium peregrinum]